MTFVISDLRISKHTEIRRIRKGVRHGMRGAEAGTLG